MLVDIDETIRAFKFEDFAISEGEEPIPPPAWVKWLIWLGQWMRVQSSVEGRRVIVVRLPNRRLAAAFTALGSTFASARLYDDSLDWEGLKGLAPGKKVFWREYAAGKPLRRSGTVVGVRQINGDDFLEVLVQGQKKSNQSSRFFAKAAALSYGITLGSVSIISDQRLSDAERVLDALITNAPKGWFRSPSIECTVITEMTSFLADLENLTLHAGRSIQANFTSILAITDSSGKTHGKTRVAHARNEGILDEVGFVTILDGAAAARRINETFSKSIVVLLDQAEYDEELEQLFQTYLDYAVDVGIHPPDKGVVPPPMSIQTFIFGLPLLPEPTR